MLSVSPPQRRQITLSFILLFYGHDLLYSSFKIGIHTGLRFTWVSLYPHDLQIQFASLCSVVARSFCSPIHMFPRHTWPRKYSSDSTSRANSNLSYVGSTRFSTSGILPALYLIPDQSECTHSPSFHAVVCHGKPRPPMFKPIKWARKHPDYPTGAFSSVREHRTSPLTMAFGNIARFVTLATLFVITYLGSVARSIPSPEFEGLDKQARDILARATPAAPHFVIYSDKGTSGITGPPPPAQVKVTADAITQ